MIPHRETEGVGGELTTERLRAIAERAYLLRNWLVPSSSDPLTSTDEGETPMVLEYHDNDDPAASYAAVHVGCGEVCGVFAEVPYCGDMGAVPVENAYAIAHAGRDLLDLVREVYRLRIQLEQVSKAAPLPEESRDSAAYRLARDQEHLTWYAIGRALGGLSSAQARAAAHRWAQHGGLKWPLRKAGRRPPGPGATVEARVEERRRSARQKASEAREQWRRDVVADYVAGDLTLKQLGERHGVTRERVRQIAMEAGVLVSGQLRQAERKRKQLLRQREEDARLYARYVTDGEQQILSGDDQLTASSLRSALRRHAKVTGDPFPVHRSRTKARDAYEMMCENPSLSHDEIAARVGFSNGASVRAQVYRYAKVNRLPIGVGARAPGAVPQRLVNARAAAAMISADPALSLDEVASRCGYANRKSLKQALRVLRLAESSSE